MRSFHDMNDAERSAYRIWETRVNDHTLSASERNKARLEMDKLLWAGPIHELRGELEALAKAVKTLSAKRDAKSMNEIAETVARLVGEVEALKNYISSLDETIRDEVQAQVAAEAGAQVSRAIAEKM
jgi:hypothetical protein